MHRSTQQNRTQLNTIINTLKQLTPGQQKTVAQQLSAHGGGKQGAGKKGKRRSRRGQSWQKHATGTHGTGLQQQTITDPMSGKPIEIVVGPKKGVNAFIRHQLRNKLSQAVYGFTPMMTGDKTIVAVAYMQGFGQMFGTFEQKTFDAIYAATKSMGYNQEFNWLDISSTLDGTIQLTTYTGQQVDDETLHAISNGLAWAAFNRQNLVAGMKGDPTRTMLFIAPKGPRHVFAKVLGATNRYGHLPNETKNETRQSVVAGAFVQSEVGSSYLYGLTAEQIKSYLQPGGGKLNWTKSSEFPGTIEDINLLDTTIKGTKSYVSCAVGQKTQLVPLTVAFKNDDKVGKTVGFTIEKQTIMSTIGAWSRTMPGARQVMATIGNADGRKIQLVGFDSLSPEEKTVAESYQIIEQAQTAAA